VPCFGAGLVPLRCYPMSPTVPVPDVALRVARVCFVQIVLRLVGLKKKKPF